MSIVNSTYKKLDEPAGAMIVYETHTDHLGKIYTRVYHADSGHDADAALADYALQLANILAEQEFSEVLGD